MPRAGWVRPEIDHRLSDNISWGLLAKVFPPATVDAVIERCGRLERRTRVLPSRLVAYYVMGLAMFSRSPSDEVIRILMAGQSWSSGLPDPRVAPSRAALAKARVRLGHEPMQMLFAEVAEPFATSADRTSFYGSLRMMSIDSACLDVPNTEPNVAGFGRPIDHSPTGSKHPQVQIVGLTETGTRSIVDAAVGGVNQSRRDLAMQIHERLPAGSLVLAGRGYLSRESWTLASASGAELLWRLRPDELTTIDRQHEDGSYATRLTPPRSSRGSRRGAEVRVVEYTVPARSGTDRPQTYRLATTLTDPDFAPAAELSELHSQRWRIATAFDELRAHHTSPRVVLRSKFPDSVRQEVFGYLCVHYAVRWLMHDVDRGSGTLALDFNGGSLK